MANVCAIWAIFKEAAFDVATAYKIARIVYTMLKEHTPFQAANAEAYDQQYRL